MSSDDEQPVFRSMKDAKDDAHTGGVINKKINKTKKKPVVAKKQEPEKIKKVENKPEINAELLAIIDEELPQTTIKAVEKDKDKTETKLKRMREKGETKQIIIPIEAKMKRRFADEIEVVYVKKDYIPKGTPENLQKIKNFQNNIFNRNNLKRAPLSKILRK
jgi:DNA-binding cell septation regulator SpoVG